MNIITKLTGAETLGEKLTWGLMFAGAIGISIGMAWDGIKQDIAEKRELKKYKSSVIQYIDKNQNGLDFQESYGIKELMDIQNNSIKYVPTLKDWKRAYNKINQ